MDLRVRIGDLTVLLALLKTFLTQALEKLLRLALFRKQVVTELFTKLDLVLSVAAEKALLRPSFRMRIEVVAVGLSERNTRQTEAVVHPLVVHEILGTQAVDPDLGIPIMISAKLDRVAILPFQKFDHAYIIRLGQIPFREASSLFNLATLLLVTFDLTHHPVSDLLSIEKGELVCRQQSWNIRDRIAQICVRYIDQTLRFFGTQLLQVLVDNTEKDGDCRKNRQDLLDLCLIARSTLNFIGLDLLEGTLIICEER